MFKVVRGDEPPCLSEEKTKGTLNYRCDGVVATLKEIFCNKCYLCENSQPTAINVEHFLPASRHQDKILDWGNLFYCCRHCNSMKSNIEKFDKILNPCDPDFDPLRFLKYDYNPFPGATPIVTNIIESEEAVNTAELLSKIFKGTTDISSEQAINLKMALSKSILEFLTDLQLFTGLTSQEEKDQFAHFLKIKHLSSSSAFVAIKKSIINQNNLNQNFSLLLR